jgi:cell division protein FtsW (lipid II flippase)
MNQKAYYDSWLLLAVVTLLGLGLVMVTSASVTLAENQAQAFLRYANHQALALGLGVFACDLYSDCFLEKNFHLVITC